MNSHFKNIPSRDLLVESLRSNGLLGALDEVDIKLFEYSSYNPVFLISIYRADGMSVVVMRGAAEIVGSLSKRPELALYDEVLMMQVLKNHGVEVPSLILNGKICSVENFYYFLMSYVPGIAVDRALRSLSDQDREILVGGVASVYAKVHKIKGSSFGQVKIKSQDQSPRMLSYIDAEKQRLIKLLDFDDFNCAELIDKYQQYNYFALDVFGKAVKKYPQLDEPTLTIYDGSAGNMLVDGINIALIDFDRTSFSVALIDFCATLFCLEWYFFDEKYGGEKWENYLNEYRNRGGWLPSKGDFEVLFPHIFIDYLLSCMVDGLNHRIPKKRSDAKNLATEIINLLDMDAITIDNVIRSIRKIKNH